jgi:hypothetical protein
MMPLAEGLLSLKRKILLFDLQAHKHQQCPWCYGSFNGDCHYIMDTVGVCVPSKLSEQKGGGDLSVAVQHLR